MKDDIEQLTVRANGGDDAARAQLIADFLPYWIGAARSILAADTRSIGSSIAGEDAEDLAQEAITSLLKAWSRGLGPKENVRSYVTSSMRNAALNKRRSPRSREVPLDVVDDAAAEDDQSNVRSVELARERAAVARALAQLPADYRDVLVHIVVEGQKPGELTERLGRGAPAISNLLVRAKQALRRLVLIDYLSAGGGECTRNAQRLPKRVHDHASAHRTSDAGLQHVRDCADCQRNWHRFAAMATAFGVIPLMTLISIERGAGVAHAAAGGEETATHLNSGEPAAQLTTAAPRAGSIASSTGVLKGGILLTLCAPVLAFAPMFLNQLSGGDGAVGSSLQGAHAYEADLTVDLDVDTAGRLHQFTIGVTTEEPVVWELDRIDIALAPGTRIIGASNGYSCDTAGQFFVCTPTETSTPETAVTMYTENAVGSGAFEARLVARIADSARPGEAYGRW